MRIRIELLRFGDGSILQAEHEFSGHFGRLPLTIVFSSRSCSCIKKTREYGLMMQPDGTLRAMYNRNNQKDEYTIKDGKFTANGNPTLTQHRCR